MKAEKEYIFKKRSTVFDIVVSLFLLAALLFFLITAFRSPLALLIIGTIPCVLLYFQWYVIRIISQFNKYDAGKKIIINADRSALTFICSNYTVEVKKDDVAKVEIYDQKNLGKFGRYNYVVVYTNDQKKLLITRFTIPLLISDRILEAFLSKKPRTYFKKQFNYINEEQFKL